MCTTGEMIFLKYFLRGRGMRGGMGRRVSASIRRGYLGGKTRVRVFNFSLRFGIRIEEERDWEGLRGGWPGVSEELRRGYVFLTFIYASG